MDEESIIAILKEIMRRHLRDLELSGLDLSSEKFKKRSWWDKGNREFWAASVGGSKRDFASRAYKMTEEKFAELAKSIIEEERTSKRS